ncbi:hypothetical protein BCR44DRAFT_1083366 [Catenaria anguillulae PL171]|uniref:Uncharacterized protein n=1 Tax=Catenaria anguillulae PL171 TaxID=765915 RepID=A0A1Y2HNH1_9FUNG|nr:hypothetical protein BCR44DRAFT_1083366 [Catenaria anguillulae PL171]
MLGILANSIMSSSSSDLSSKGRSLLHKVTNKSSLPLILAADLHESGRWWTVPPATIPPAGGIATYSSCNRDGGILTGTTGAVAYRVAHTDFYVALFFSNPYVGAFKAGAKVYRGLPSTAQLKTDYASNDVVLVKQGTTVFGSIHVGFAPAVDRDSPATYTFDIQGDSLSGVPLESLVPPADSEHQPKRQHPLAVPRSIDPPYSLRLLSYNLFLRPLLVATRPRSHQMTTRNRAPSCLSNAPLSSTTFFASMRSLTIRSEQRSSKPPSAGISTTASKALHRAGLLPRSHRAFLSSLASPSSNRTPKCLHTPSAPMHFPQKVLSHASCCCRKVAPSTSSQHTCRPTRAMSPGTCTFR